MIDSIFLVRYGRYDTSTMGLTTEGRDDDAPKALEELLAKGIGSHAIVLSSSATHALHTAEIIAGAFHVDVISSDLINIGGNKIAGVRNLDEFVCRALARAQVNIHDNSELVVVTHAPMVAAAMGMHDVDAADHIGYGQVVEYITGTWTNPRFNESLEV